MRKLPDLLAAQDPARAVLVLLCGVLLASRAGAQSGVSLFPLPRNSVGTSPSAVAVGDFNGDVTQDLAAVLFLSFASTPTFFKGGTLITVPVALSVGVTITGAGAFVLPWASWPSGMPPGTAVCFQYGIQDAAAVFGVSLSNAMVGTTP